MRMQKRTDIKMQFSSFLLLESALSVQTYWYIARELEQNIQRCLQKSHHFGDSEIIAKQLLQNLRQKKDSFSQQHLTAYLQESSFFATQTVYRRLYKKWDLFEWQDYFQWANLFVAQPLNLLQRYDHKFNSKITTYAKSKIEGQLIDQAYQYMGWSRASDWGLLRKMNPTNQTKALEIMGGLRGNYLAQHLLITECFNIVYKSSVSSKSKILPPPSKMQLEAITVAYNNFAQNNPSLYTSITVQQCQKLLNFCVECARNFANPNIIKDPNYLDSFASDNNEDTQESTTEYHQVNNILANKFRGLEKSHKIIFILWQGLHINQKDIAKIMSTHYGKNISQQFHIAREVNQARKILLEHLIEEIILQQQESKEINLADLSKLKYPLNDWIREYADNYFRSKLDQIFNQLSIDNRKIIKQASLKLISQQTQEKQPTQLFNIISLQLQNSLAHDFSLDWTKLTDVDEYFYPLIEEWLIYHSNFLD
ncbi:MAG: sigma-70 family RNA polymerase sigma factor [Cyanobacterium sp. T60_A2020_053]|nr:sigma-70 family RNA polymerase sigma factor [Cyanobacterium sp. T60_A2020_053]